MVLNVFVGIISTWHVFALYLSLMKSNAQLCIFLYPSPSLSLLFWGAHGWGLDEFFFLSLSLFLYKGEKYQLTKDKKWTVNTLNKAQQEQEPAFSLYLSLPPIFYSLHLSQREGSELTKCQLTLNVWPLRFPPGAADSDGVWVNTEGLQRIIILLLRPHPPSPIPPSPPILNPFILFPMGWFYSSMHVQRVI